MNSLRIKNLRSLVDTNVVDLKPITLLLGQNSSGKSTFLRTFPLLRQSVEARTTGPILWYGQYVDFGNFQDSLYLDAEEPEISIEFNFDLRERSSLRYRLIRWENIKNITINLVIASDARVDFSYHKKINIRFEDHEIDLRFNSAGQVISFVVNKRDVSSVVSEFRSNLRGILPHIIDTVTFAEAGDVIDNRLPPLLKQLVNEVKKYVHGKTLEENVIDFARTLPVGNSELMLTYIQNAKNSTETWKERVSKWTLSSPEFLVIRDFIIAYSIPNLINICDEHIVEYYRNIKYIAPLRATAERYYRIQNLALDDVDFQGQNLAMFLRNLTEGERKHFSEWTEKFFGFSIVMQTSMGHVSIALKEKDAKKEINLADMGFGFSQILPILTQLWMITGVSKQRFRSVRSSIPITFAIEQPELHLHPKLQAKFAEAIVDVINLAYDNNLNVILVIETHSETIINKIGHLISDSILAPEDVNVVLFDKPETSSQTFVVSGTFDPDGYLTNWPIGFFDAEG